VIGESEMTLDRPRLKRSTRGRPPAYTPRDKFRWHKGTAAQRGIPFLLSFDEWWSIWERSGRWHQRGCRRGHYCMARNGDVGAYVTGNVKIIPCEKNNSEGHLGRSGNAKIGPLSARLIRRKYARGGKTQRDLAGEFGIARSTVSNIVAGRLWANLKREGITR
jgi:hypothetical protein